jgi:hypothetical protein
VLAAQVVLTRVEDKSERSATTDADGAFHFVNLRPGHYDLLISASGFAEFKISSAQLDARQTCVVTGFSFLLFTIFQT